MTDKERLRQIADAFLIESGSDAKAVPLLIENNQYNLAIYHAQQSIEKLLKACLAAEGKIGIYKHEIFYFFRKAIGNKFSEDEMTELTNSIPELEEEWSAARYPAWEDGHIWIPSENYTLDDALQIEEKMNIASGILIKYLEDKHALRPK